MRYIVLNGKEYAARKDFYQDIREKMEFPDYFGNNLDALHDCLSEVREETVILLRNRAVFEENLGSYVQKIERVLKESAKENDRLSCRWTEEEK